MFTSRPRFVTEQFLRCTSLACAAIVCFLLVSGPLHALPPSAVPFVDIVPPVSITPGSTGVVIFNPPP